MEKTKLSLRGYTAIVFEGLAKGLFSSLIIGVVIKQIGVYSGLELLVTLGQVAQYMMGPAIGAGVAYARNCRQFTTLSAIVAGAIGAGTISLEAAGGWMLAIGEPVGGFCAALLGVEVGKLIEGRSRFDLLLVPAAVIVIGGLVGIFLSPYMSACMKWLGAVINSFTVMQPLPSGLLLGLGVGMILSSPVSSAGVCIAIGLDGLAAGAALAGCCAQMVGFAVSSYRENRAAGLLAIGLGTSKLLLPNIVRHPWIWLPPSLASAVCGTLSAAFFEMKTTAVGAGMGLCALVGPITTVAVMGSESLWRIAVLNVAIPVLISMPLSEFMRKKGLIQPGNMRLG